MSAGIYANINGVTRKGKKLYAKVNGVTRPIKEVWVKVNGVSRKVYSGAITVTTSGFELDYPYTQQSNTLSAKELAGTTHGERKCCAYAHYGIDYYHDDGDKLYQTFTFSDPISFSQTHDYDLWVYNDPVRLWTGTASRRAYAVTTFRLYSSAGVLLYTTTGVVNKEGSGITLNTAVANVKSIQAITTLSKDDYLEYEAYIAFGVWPDGNYSEMQPIYNGAELAQI